MPVAGPKKLFVALRDAPERRAALKADAGSAERYRLYGIDQLVSRGVEVRHNLERPGGSPLWARAADWAINHALYGMGGYGGDFASVLTSLRLANAADVVLSTVDTVGLPLVLLKRAGLVRRPVVYTSIGLPERLVQLRGERMRRLYRAALGRADAIVAYAEHEAQWLRDWVGPPGPPVVFLPFAVDLAAFQPDPVRTPNTDVVSVGADPHRDFELLVDVASRHPELSFRIVASAERARSLATLPANVDLEVDLALDEARERLEDARLVALPVRENSYSGATTVLLQAMALGKPVVVSRTAAIASGYELEDEVNCRLVEPGDVVALERAILETLTGADAGLALGTRARQTVERGFSWERYTDALWEVLLSVTRSPSG
ncbi:MAG: glycosyltransferase family 4 protein [Gaiellaceae bacterium]